MVCRFVSPASFALAAAAAVALVSQPAGAAVTADEVVGYTPGAPRESYWKAPYDNAAAALGLPAPRHGLAEVKDSRGDTVIFGDDSYVTPVNAAYNPDHVVAIGDGGSLTLKLAQPVAATGQVLGVHAGVGLGWNFETGTANGGTYTDDRIATVRVSADNQQWVSLGSVTFGGVTNYYADATDPFGYGGNPAQAADVSKPSDAVPADFAGMSFDRVVQELGGSAGGTWLDLTAAGLAQVQYIEFSVPAGSGQFMFVDSVVAVPEPAAAAVALVLLPALLAGRRRRR